MRARLKNISRIALATFISLLLAASSFAAHAQGLGGVSFASFASDITLNADSSFDVVESITGSFQTSHHGIFRFIPVEYERAGQLPLSIHLQVQSVTLGGEPVPYEVSRSGSFEVVKIGDPDVTFHGPFSYVIRYQVQDAILFHDANDELYWNVSGDKWDAPIKTETVTVHVDDVPADQIEGDCFRGAFGSHLTCPQTIAAGTYSASGNGPITISVRFPKGVVKSPSALLEAKWWLQDHWDVFFLLLPIAVFFFVFHRWWFHGRDPKGRGTIVAEYEPPDGLRPAEVGTLVDAKFDQKEFSATIVDLAVRGYLKIVDGTTYRFQRMKLEDASMKPYEATVYRLLFGMGMEAVLDERRTALRLGRKTAEQDVYASMATDGYYVKDPQKARAQFAGIGFLILGFTFIGFKHIRLILETPFLFIALAATAVLLIVFAQLMPQKTHKGALAAEQALGFKEYLEKAEKYRVQWQEKEGIFEKYLPYAMVFGVADKWTRALAVTQTSSPVWYVGNSGTWNVHDFNDRMDSFTSSMAAVSAPARSGGGGGGGFSGGGFGGGGGGSW